LRKRKPRNIVLGRARILRMTPTKEIEKHAGRLNVEHRVGLLVEARKLPPYEVEILVWIPHDIQLSTGREVPVRVNRFNPQRVEIDMEELPSITLSTRMVGEPEPEA
jgi:hypothetical protein